MRQLRLSVVLCSLVATVPVVLARSAEEPRKVVMQIEDALQKAYPERVRALKESLQRGLDSQAVTQVLGLTTDTRASLGAGGYNYSNPDPAAQNYIRTWAMVVALHGEAKDPAQKERLVEAWNDSLVDDVNVPFELRGLGAVWDRAFLTDRFWQLLATSANPHTISIIGHLIAERGVPPDADKLRARLHSTKNPQIRDIISRCLGYMEWWQKGSPPPGPAYALPDL